MSKNDIAVSVRGLSKSYTIAHQGEKHVTLAEQLLAKARRPFARVPKETFWALKDVEFDIKKGDVVGIIGRNGAGKSTLLKVLSRITEPTAGQVDLYGRVGSLLEVGTGFHPELTGRENVFLNGAILGMTKAEIRKQFDAIVDFSGVEQFLDTPVKRYSSGMYVRLAFAVAAHLESEILIVDEVLAVGDADFQAKCLRKMHDVAHGGRTVLFVSHNMAAISRMCNRGIYLDSGEIRHSGTVEDAVKLYTSIRVNVGLRILESGPVRRISATDRDGALEVSVSYCLDEPPRTVSLGFVVRDAHGNIVFGCNPALSGSPPTSVSRSSGQVTALVRAPRLRSGDYSLSIWLGDGVGDSFEAQDVLSFRILTPSAGDERAMSLGPVVPEVQWFATERASA